MKIRNLFLGIAAFAAILTGQQAAPEAERPATPLRLVPSEPLTEPPRPRKVDQPMPPASAEPEVRPAILKLKPAGDPIYFAEEPPVESGRDKWRTYQRPKVEMFSRNGERVAVQGYDVVSYQERHAEKGREEFSAGYGGVSWHFASADHRDQFKRDPESFLPQYGGFCAYSVGRGYPVTPDPRAYVLDGRKLYLFFDKAVQTVWEQDQHRLVTAADRYWPQLHR